MGHGKDTLAQCTPEHAFAPQRVAAVRQHSHGAAARALLHASPQRVCSGQGTFARRSARSPQTLRRGQDRFARRRFDTHDLCRGFPRRSESTSTRMMSNKDKRPGAKATENSGSNATEYSGAKDARVLNHT